MAPPSPVVEALEKAVNGSEVQRKAAQEVCTAVWDIHGDCLVITILFLSLLKWKLIEECTPV